MDLYFFSLPFLIPILILSATTNGDLHSPNIYKAQISFQNIVRDKLQHFCPVINSDTSLRGKSKAEISCSSLNDPGELIVQFNPLNCVNPSPLCTVAHPAFIPHHTENAPSHPPSHIYSLPSKPNPTNNDDDIEDDYYTVENEDQNSIQQSLFHGLGNQQNFKSSSQASQISSQSNPSLRLEHKCVLTTIPTNTLIQFGIQKHIGIYPILHDLILLYFLYSKKIIGVQEELLSQPLYAGRAAVNSAKEILTGLDARLKRNKFSSPIDHSRLGPDPSEQIPSAIGATSGGLQIYNALLFALSFIHSTTWRNAQGLVKLNIVYANSASFSQTANSEQPHLSRSDSLVAAFFRPLHHWRW